MKCRIVMPHPSATDAVAFTAIAEDHGWDGFVWESVWGIDAWVSLGAAAVRTETIQLGTMQVHSYQSQGNVAPPNIASTTQTSSQRIRHLTPTECANLEAEGWQICYPRNDAWTATQ